jgi:hypothetical protein
LPRRCQIFLTTGSITTPAALCPALLAFGATDAVRQDTTRPGSPTR